ncbi:MAG: response regulator transcription factor [Erysipelotrichales bacterium]
MKKILLIEDDLGISEALVSFLSTKNYEVTDVTTGKGALEYLENNSFDLILLDLMLPDYMGESLMKYMHNIPIIVISAKSEEDDVVNGLLLGASDYLRKPFSMKELEARIRLRLVDSNDYDDGSLIVVYDEYQVKLNNEIVELTQYELEILFYLIKNINKVISRQQIIEYAFSNEYQGNDRTIDTHIKNLRKKIELDNKYIITIRGIGYKFVGNNYEE